ncbi:NUDIX hydrolase [Loigolactobacillus bifermentans]|jgi:8-oxo-dGTP pyrophosphatase MutT (NUDIX family)|uniref:Nudix hydrolase domain-containing protein n=1 Tax=Loigolactobacillus bifermentans DSM 20003 TaxID=1423726 RepID=A0A0R1GZ13_9LACO|nr:NUDIX hydrolase [Loigolactobacillus bifermentans]KRK39611.1 hypothetical protein FC07_GL002348 [Loigolactobacillus bifermentans DSM 20003]QGG60765.1 NUDIX domain-containing protein [Loigolactobacillus bifermentans]
MERWDIYDKNKQKTGRTMARNDWRMVPGDYHLTVIGILQRPDGRFLITQRKMDKDWGAGWWEVTGGGVRAGETSEQAVRRELREETTLDVSQAQGGYAFTYQRDNPAEQNNYFVDVYKFIMAFDKTDIAMQAEEVSHFDIVTADQIKAYADQGIFLHYNALKTLFVAPTND